MAKKLTGKKKAAKKKLPKGWKKTKPAVGEPGLGEITDETPIGRRFEFDELAEAEVLTYQGLDKSGIPITICFGGPVAHPLRMPLGEWREKWAPHVTGYTDTPSAAPDALEEFAEPEQPAAEGAAGSVDAEPILADIREQARLVLEAKKVWLAAKEDAAEAKKIFDNRDGKLLDMITEPPPETPLFDKPAEQDKDFWRGMKITELELSPRIVDALAAHEPAIVTLGDLTDWQEEKAEFWAKDIKGIGQAAADKIAEATDAFWAKRKAQEDAPAEALAKAEG